MKSYEGLNIGRKIIIKNTFRTGSWKGFGKVSQWMLIGQHLFMIFCCIESSFDYSDNLMQEIFLFGLIE
jgi:hypothetical protein